MEVVVARIGRPHGVRGEVSVQLRTDDPERRLAAGEVLVTDPPAAGPLTVRAARRHGDGMLLVLAGVGDRDDAEALRGVLLLAETGDPGGDGDNAEDAEPDAWTDAELVGLAAVTVAGLPAGVVVGVRHGAAQDLLEVRQPSGADALVPFVRAIVPEVDVAGGRLVLDPPGGLLDVVPGEVDPVDSRPRDGEPGGDEPGDGGHA